MKGFQESPFELEMTQLIFKGGLLNVVDCTLSLGIVFFHKLLELCKDKPTVR